jgi:hypothetical protein
MLFVTVTAQSQYSLLDFAIQKNGEYLLSEFGSYPISKKIGAFVYLSKQKGYTNIAPGIYLNKKLSASNRVYWETGAGYGTTLPKKSLGEPTDSYVHYYFWFETKPNDQVAKGKVYMQINPAYTFGSYDSWQDNWWIQNYAIYSLSHHIGMGLHYQTQSAKGVRISYDIQLGHGNLLRSYLVAGSGALVGISCIYQKQ